MESQYKIVSIRGGSFVLFLFGDLMGGSDAVGTTDDELAVMPCWYW